LVAQDKTFAAPRHLSRSQGEQFLGFYDVHRDCLSGVFRKHKRLPDLFDAFRRLPATPASDSS
jgi:hypothetical protein